MHIRCPKCGRRGYLPDRLAPEAHSLRCRKCRAHFTTPDLSRPVSERAVAPAFETAASVGIAEQPAAFLTDGFFSGFDDRRESPRDRGPGDSSYELTFTLRDAGSDSSTEWEATAAAIEPEAPSSDEIEAIDAAAASSHAPDPWHVHFIESWARPLIIAALGMIAVAIAAIGYLVWRTAGSEPIGSPLPTLIAGFACAIALLMIAIPLTVLAACLMDLVRDVRRLRQHLERRTEL